MLTERKKRQCLCFWLGAALVAASAAMPWPIAWVLLAAGLYMLLWPRRNVIPVLTYHSVTANREWMGAPDLVVSPQLFAKQMNWLKKNGWRSLWMDELQAQRNERKCGRFFAVHFDDGYSDTKTHVLPILEKYRFRGTVFIAPGLLRDGPVHYLLPDRKDLDRNAFLAASDVRSLAENGHIEVQSHGWTHRELTALPEAELKAELSDSKAWLSKLSPVSGRHLCFPRDAVNTAVHAAAIEAGYASVTAGKSYNGSKDTGTVSRVYITASGNMALDMMAFYTDVLLFRGVYALWPFRTVLKRAIRSSWKQGPTARNTP